MFNPLAIVYITTTITNTIDNPQKERHRIIHYRTNPTVEINMLINEK